MSLPLTELACAFPNHRSLKGKKMRHFGNPSTCPFHLSINCLGFFVLLLGQTQPSSLLFRASLFIYHHLLNVLACLPSFRCQERSQSSSVRVRHKKLSLSDYVAILLPVAISCRLSAQIHAAKDERNVKSKGRAGVSSLSNSLGFDTSNNLLGFRLKSYRQH